MATLPTSAQDATPKKRSALWSHSAIWAIPLDPYERTVLLRMHAVASDWLQVQNYAQSLLASDCGISERKAKSVLKSLVNKGLLTTSKCYRPGSVKLDISTYQLADLSQIKDLKLKVSSQHSEVHNMHLENETEVHNMHLEGAPRAQTMHLVLSQNTSALEVFNHSWFFFYADKWRSFDVVNFILCANHLLSADWIGKSKLSYISKATAMNMISWHRALMHSGESRSEMVEIYKLLAEWLIENGRDRPRTYAQLFDAKKVYEYLQLADVWKRERSIIDASGIGRIN